MCAVDVPAFMIHAPPMLVVVGQAHRLRRGARHRDGHVRSGVLPVGAAEVVEHRPELGLHARAVFLRRVEQRLLLVALRFELHVLRDALEVGDARALERERLLSGLSGSVVADQAVRALPAACRR